LNEEETKVLQKNLDTLFARIFLLEMHNKKLRKKIAKRRGSTARGGMSNLSELSIKLNDLAESN
jgi:hypothetical protein